MNKQIKTILVEDESIYRKCLIAYLKNRPQFDVLGGFSDGLMAIEHIKKHPDVNVVLLDLYLDTISGLEVTNKILAIAPAANILILSREEDPDIILNVLKNGAKGFINKDAPMEELLVGIEALANGKNFFSSNISGQLIPSLTDFKKKEPGHAIKTIITKRELQILEYLFKELTNKEIAEKLFISPRTVDTHKRNLRKKLNVKSSVGLVKYYLDFYKNKATG